MIANGGPRHGTMTGVGALGMIVTSYDEALTTITPVRHDPHQGVMGDRGGKRPDGPRALINIVQVA